MRVKISFETLFLLFALSCFICSCEKKKSSDDKDVKVFYNKYRESNELDFFKGITIHPVRGVMGIVFADKPNITYLYKYESKAKYYFIDNYHEAISRTLDTIIYKFNSLGIWGVQGHQDISYIKFKIHPDQVMVYVPEPDRLSDEGQLLLKNYNAIKFADKWFYYIVSDHK